MKPKDDIKAMSVIECPMVQGDLRDLDVCEQCEHFSGIREVRPEGTGKSPDNPKGYPALHMIYCRIPKGIVVKKHLVENFEVVNKEALPNGNS